MKPKNESETPETLSGSETLTPVSEHIAVHRDGEHECFMQYEPMKDGDDLRTHHTFKARGDGTYERYDPSGGSIHGPAQVATPAYRNGWDATFGVNATGGQA